MIGKVRTYWWFASKCATLMAEDRRMLALLVLLSVLGTLTEGLTISLLVPILESQGDANSFAEVPLLGEVASFFARPDPFETVRLAALVLMVAVITRAALQFGITILGALIPLALQRRLMQSAYDVVLATQMNHLSQKESGYLLNGFRDLPQRVASVLTAFVEICWNLILVGVYCLLMLLLSWQLTILCMLFLGAVTVLLKYFTSKPLHREGQRLTGLTTSFNKVAIETLFGIRLIRLAAAEGVMRRKFATVQSGLLDAQRTLTKLAAIPAPALSAVAGAFVCALLIAGTYIHEAPAGEWLSQIILLLFLLSRLLSPVSTINVVRSRIIRDMHAFDEMDRFIQECKAHCQTTGDVPFSALRERINFESLSFTYDPAKGRVLHDVTLSIPKGATVAIVGPSGAGKSTLIGLLTRLYDPDEGRITVDGTDLRQYDVHQWRRHIGVVSQDTVLFNDTIYNNLVFGIENPDPSRVRHAAEAAAATEFIDALPLGYDTPLGDQGIQLSGGQRQRLALARAILNPGDLLILDEATSHLDAITERAIQDAITRMHGHRTCVLIAHRLATIRHADMIVVMKAGRVVETGEYMELVRARGVFWDLAQHQQLNLVEDAQK